MHVMDANNNTLLFSSEESKPFLLPLSSPPLHEASDLLGKCLKRKFQICSWLMTSGNFPRWKLNNFFYFHFTLEAKPAKLDFWCMTWKSLRNYKWTIAYEEVCHNSSLGFKMKQSSLGASFGGENTVGTFWGQSCGLSVIHICRAVVKSLCPPWWALLMDNRCLGLPCTSTWAIKWPRLVEMGEKSAGPFQLWHCSSKTFTLCPVLLSGEF